MLRSIKGFEGFYSVDELGNIYSHRSMKYLKPVKIVDYYQVCFSIHQQHKNYFVHKLVAEAFLPNPEHKKQVNHLDGDKLNNKLENLEWVTPSENNIHAIRVLHAYHPIPPRNDVRGEKNGCAKLTAEQVTNIRKDRQQGMILEDIADKYGTTFKNISLICLGRRWKHLLSTPNEVGVE